MSGQARHDGDAVVTTSAGRLRGRATGRGYAWLGVPYAAPPVGAGRFRPPRPPTGWAGVRDALAFGPMCVQPGGDRGSEDCLYLNVWSPGTTGTPRPVLVYVHGGGFVAGSGDEYDGSALSARGDVVVVTLNYRLGPWGFLHLADLDAQFADCANLTLRDLIAALEWVRDNIAAFGGDPRRVTLFGQSAGAMLIGSLLAVPAVAGLCHAAAMFSGTGQLVHDRSDAAEVVHRLLAELALPRHQAGRLRTLPAATLSAAADAVRLGSDDERLGCHAYLPVVDGDLLPRHPMAAAKSGATARVPLLVSWCRDEMAAFSSDGPDSFLPRGQRAYGRRRLGGPAWHALEAAYRRQAGPGTDPVLALTGDALFGMPAIRLAELWRHGGGHVWLMRFDHGPAIDPYQRLGPTHGADVACLWSEVGVFQRSAAVGGPTPAPMPPADRAVTAALQDALLALARTGSPEHRGLPGWLEYGEPDRVTLLMRDEPCTAADPDAWRRTAWEGLPLP
jgi:para-nitrobenzyl esterase